MFLYIFPSHHLSYLTFSSFITKIIKLLHESGVTVSKFVLTSFKWPLTLQCRPCLPYIYWKWTVFFSFCMKFGGFGHIEGVCVSWLEFWCHAREGQG